MTLERIIAKLLQNYCIHPNSVSSSDPATDRRLEFVCRIAKSGWKVPKELGLILRRIQDTALLLQRGTKAVIFIYVV